MPQKRRPPALARAAPKNVSLRGLDASEDGQRATATQVVVAEFEKNSRETFRVSLDQYRGRDVVDIRVWWRDDDGVMRPSRTGITTSVKDLSRLAAAIAAALVEVRSRGLLSPEVGEPEPSDEVPP